MRYCEDCRTELDILDEIYEEEKKEKEGGENMKLIVLMYKIRYFLFGYHRRGSGGCKIIEGKLL